MFIKVYKKIPETGGHAYITDAGKRVKTSLARMKRLAKDHNTPMILKKDGAHIGTIHPSGNVNPHPNHKHLWEDVQEGMPSGVIKHKQIRLV